MKPNLIRWTVLFLLVAGAQVPASDRELCQGGYPVMLMTEMECKVYLDSRQVLQGSADTAAVQLLDAHVRDQLADRAKACNCSESPPGKVALSQSDC